MRVVIQRTTQASVTIEDKIVGSIKKGLVILVGFESEDNEEDLNWICRKICGLRIFSDIEGKMNLNIADIEGDFLVISQFTLHAKTKKGNRPSFIHAAKPEIAIPLYEKFVQLLQSQRGRKVATGEFGADMQVQLINDGPVTITIDTKNKE